MSQFINLLGVLEDGSDYAPDVPKNTAQPFSFPRLSDVLITLQVVHPDGTSVDMTASGVTATLAIRRDLPNDVVLIPDILKSGVPKAGYPNTVTFAITPDDTKELGAGGMYYDVNVTSGGKRYEVVQTAVATLTPVCSSP